jgi:hypothetical protein
MPELNLLAKCSNALEAQNIVAIPKIHTIKGNMIEVIEKGQPKNLAIGKNYRDELLDLIDKDRL